MEASQAATFQPASIRRHGCAVRCGASEILVIGDVVKPLPVESSKYFMISITGHARAHRDEHRRPGGDGI